MRGKFYRDADLQAYDRDALAIIVEARGVTVEGTGRSGYVTVEDMREAITADQDRSGLNPAIVAEPVEAQIIYVIVTGGAPVHGATIGERLALYDNAQTAALLEGGSVTLASAIDELAPVQASDDHDVDTGAVPTDDSTEDEPAGAQSPDNDDTKGD